MNVMYSSLPPIQMTDDSSHRLADDKSLDDLAPIFPPPNFEVPDIRFSNSVSPNADFNQSLLTSAHMYNLFMSPEVQTRHLLGDSSCGAAHQHKNHSPVDALALEMSGMNQQQLGGFPQASSSPLGTSSSDDADDTPSSQLTNQSETSNLGPNKATNHSASQTSDQTGDQTASVGSGSAAGSVGKKSKACKRKKRKDPNEPQKPVSAYALFFRDSQAAIKGHNPSASFGEVSKIVASMWDQLNPEHKEVYKKKTEVAKKQYLKQLAAYRANQVSQLASEDAKKAPLSPGNKNRPESAEDMTAATNFQNQDSHLQAGLAGHILALHSTLPSTHLVQMSPHLLQQQQQQRQQQQQQQRQLHHHHQQQLQQQQRHQISMGTASSSPLAHQQLCTSQHSPRPGPAYTYPPHVDQGGRASYQTSLAGHRGLELSDAGENTSRTYPPYPGNGCSQHTRGHPGWETEYYNSESVIPQCRDVFTNWVGPGPSTSTFPVK